MITLDQAKNLTLGTVLYHTANRNADGTPQRWRVNGKPKTWKTRPKEVSVPIKHGMYDYDYITHNDLALVFLSEDDALGDEMSKPKVQEEEVIDRGNTLTIKDKEDALTLRWLQMATYKGVGRDSLSGIFNDNGKWIATDGFRLHIAKSPVLPNTLKPEAVTKLNRTKPLNKTTGKAYPVELVSGTVYPDYDQIVRQVESKEPKAVIRLQKKYLKELAEMPDDVVGGFITLEIYSTTDPIDAYNEEYRAIIMPVAPKD